MRLSRPSSTIWRASIWPAMFTRAPLMLEISVITASLNSFCSLMKSARLSATVLILAESSLSRAEIAAARSRASWLIAAKSSISFFWRSEMSPLMPLMSPLMPAMSARISLTAVWRPEMSPFIAASSVSTKSLSSATSVLSALLALRSAIEALTSARVASIVLRREFTTPSSFSRSVTLVARASTVVLSAFLSMAACRVA